jgi:hypothetical protein
VIRYSRGRAGRGWRSASSTGQLVKGEHHVPDLRYHQAVLDLIGVEATTSSEAIAKLDRFEAEHGPLPASLREWYSLVDGVDILTAWSNEGYAFPPEKWAAPVLDVDEEKVIFEPLREQGLIRIVTENQGICHTAVKLDGSADPPVLCALDDVGPDSQWLLDASTFSDSVYTRIWDGQTHLERWVSVDEPVASEAFLRHLRTDFEPRPDAIAGFYPGPVLRFASPGDRQRTRLVRDPDDAGHWTFWADSNDLLEDLLRRAFEVDTLASALRTRQGFLPEESARVLQRLRS